MGTKVCFNVLKFNILMFLIQNMRIANAYELAAGNDPSDVSFDKGKMGKHLVKCWRKVVFEPFPR